ncbi:hypothetical protein EMCRGX_G012423 [Ephydatia muelleri]
MVESASPGPHQPWSPSALVPISPGPHQPWSPSALVPISPGPHQPWSPSALVPISPGPHQPWAPSALVPISPGPHQPWSPSGLVPISPGPHQPWSPSALVPISSGSHQPCSPSALVPISPGSNITVPSSSYSKHTHYGHHVAWTRPADLLVTNWDNGISAAFNVTVASPLNSNTITKAVMYSSAAARAAELRKHTQNDSKCAELRWKCIPLAVECYGVWGPEALKAFS